MPVEAPRIVLGKSSADTLAGGSADVALFGTGRAVPGGIECVFSYNQFIFNDTSVIDKIRVLKISGLDDAEIRDSREENPGSEGETAHDAFPGGRTMVFEGRVEAFSLKKLRDMQMAFRSAFVDLQEKPLYFLTGDASTEHYIRCRKSQKLQWDDEQTNGNTFFRPFQLTLRASNPRFFRNKNKVITMAHSESNKDIFNEGNFRTQPVIRLTGQMTDIEFRNESVVNPDGSFQTMKFKAGTTIPLNDYYEIDIAKNTIVNSAGVNKFNDLDYTSDWLYLYPGVNQIAIPTGKVDSTGGGEIRFTFRDAWI